MLEEFSENEELFSGRSVLVLDLVHRLTKYENVTGGAIKELESWVKKNDLGIVGGVIPKSREAKVTLVERLP